MLDNGGQDLRSRNVCIHKINAVFARTNTTKIINCSRWQKLGGIVAVTDDGVNDSLASRTGDIGVAIGITGTEVAKQVEI